MYSFSDWLHVNDNTTVVSTENATILPSIASRGTTLLSQFGKKRRKKAGRTWLWRVTANKIDEVYLIKEKNGISQASLSGNLRSGVYFFSGRARKMAKRRTAWSQVSHMNERQLVVIIWSWISRHSLPGPIKLCWVPSTEMGRGVWLLSPFDLRLGINFNRLNL